MRSRFKSLERNLASRFGYAMRARARRAVPPPVQEEMKCCRVSKTSAKNGLGWFTIHTSSAGPHADVQELVAPFHRAVQLLELRPETHVDPFHRRAAHVPDA